MSIIYRIVRRIRRMFTSAQTVETILRKYLNKNKTAFFIQIGSNNGVNNDPLRRFILDKKLTGILIEPVSYIFQELKKNYPPGMDLIFENIAIAEFDGDKDFYRLKKTDDGNLPVWYDQLGSFNRDVILKHKAEIPDLEKHLITEKISCLTFNSLIRKHDLKKIDLIHIDTEGFDYEVIKLIDFSVISPDMIIYEHKHLSVEDNAACRRLLEQIGYSLVIDGNDTLAKRPS
jgi:FkbM family methyltransferase